MGQTSLIGIDQKSCVINGDVTTQYFKLEKGARQGDSAPAYWFILCLEICFAVIKNNKDIKILNFLRNTFYIQLMQVIRLCS